MNEHIEKLKDIKARRGMETLVEMFEKSITTMGDMRKQRAIDAYLRSDDFKDDMRDAMCLDIETLLEGKSILRTLIEEDEVEQVILMDEDMSKEDNIDD